MIAARRGFSVVEVLVAASLAVGLGFVVSAAISVSSSSSKDAINRADAAREVRQLNDVVSRFVRGAVADPVCDLPADASTFSQCVVPGSAGSLLQSASEDALTLLVYPQGAAAAGDPQPPRKVTVRTEVGDGSVSLVVESYDPSNGFYDAAYPSSPSEVLRRVVLVPPGLFGVCDASYAPAGKVFSFLDSSGRPVVSLVSDEDRARVAVVKFDAQVRVLVEGEECPRVVSSPVFLALPSRGFGR